MLRKFCLLNETDLFLLEMNVLNVLPWGVREGELMYVAEASHSSHLAASGSPCRHCEPANKCLLNVTVTRNCS